MLKDEELYEGFSKKEMESIKKEVEEKYDPRVVKESYHNARNMTKEQFAGVKEEGEQVSRDFALLMGKDPSSDEVQKVVARHYAHINNYYKPTNEMYRGLGKLYIEDDRFRAHYDRYKKDLAFFVHKAIDIFCDRVDKK